MSAPGGPDFRHFLRLFLFLPVSLFLGGMFIPPLRPLAPSSHSSKPLCADLDSLSEPSTFLEACVIQDPTSTLTPYASALSQSSTVRAAMQPSQLRSQDSSLPSPLMPSTPGSQVPRALLSVPLAPNVIWPTLPCIQHLSWCGPSRLPQPVTPGPHPRGSRSP